MDYTHLSLLKIRRKDSLSLQVCLLPVVALNLPLVGLWAKLLDIPFQYLCVGVLLFCVVGAYSLQQSMFDVWVMILFGVIGYVFRKLELPMAPLVLGLILGPATRQ